MGIGSMNSRLIPLHIGGGGSSGAASTSGTLTAAATGADITVAGFDAGSSLTFTFAWTKVGDVVCLSIVSGGTVAATSTTSVFSFTGFPANLRPSISVFAPVYAQDNTVAGALHRAQITTGGVINLQRAIISGSDVTYSTSGWTTSGTKGIAPNTQIIYSVQ
jgi:hypothetical protein